MMSVQDVLGSIPYNSTLSKNSNRVHVLFKPEFAVQTRELIEMQSVLKNQISRFADHVFSDGSVVMGGETTMKIVTWFKLNPLFNGAAISVADFDGTQIVALDSNGNALATVGNVISVAAANGTDPDTIYVDFPASLDLSNFSQDVTIKVVGSSLSAKITSLTSYTGQAIYIGINDAIYYVSGHFVGLAAQGIILTRYTKDCTGKFGFVYSFDVVTSDEDTDLLDPARGFRNYGAPGADRLVSNTSLSWFNTPQQTIPQQFVKVLELENGALKTIVKVPVYSEINDTLARRTYDESGSYTVNPFTLTTVDDTGIGVISISAGGTTLAPIGTIVTATTHSLSVAERVTIANVEGSDGLIYNGTFDVVSVIDEYRFTVSLASMPITSALGSSIRLTKPDYLTAKLSPGKAYVYGYEYETVSDTKLDVARARTTKSINGLATTAAYGRRVIGTLSTASLIDETHLNQISLLDGAGTVIGTCRVRQFGLNSGVPTSSLATWYASIYDVSMNSGKNFEDVRYIRDDFGGGILSFGSVSPTLYDGALPSLIFKIAQPSVKTLGASISPSVSYETSRKLVATTSGSPATISFTASDATFVGPVGVNFAGTDILNSNYLFVDRVGNAILAPTSAIISAGGSQITFQFSTSGVVVTVIANVNLASQSPKIKTLSTLSASLTYNSSTLSYSLGAVDVTRLASVMVGGVDYTSAFTCDSGQRDTHYDLGTINLATAIPGVSNGTAMVATFEAFVRSGNGFFSVDSYASTPYEEIPTYKSTTTGVTYRLSDCFDFRPDRSSVGSGHSGASIPAVNSNITSNVTFYLPRKDLIVIFGKSGNFAVVQGTPDVNPAVPPVPAGSMSLYELDCSAYTANAVSDVNSVFIENKRYTMRDIGRIEKRVGRLEYYTSLSLLEMQAKSSSVIDSSGLDRFKNGFLVDGFNGHSIGDVSRADYACSIDTLKRELRPPYAYDSVKMQYSTDSSGCSVVGNDATGYCVTLPYSKVKFLSQLNATRAESVNPYAVYTFNGNVFLNPSSDDWIDTTTEPAVQADLTGDLSGWTDMANTFNEMAAGFGTNWGAWNTTWSGVTDQSTSTTDAFGYTLAGNTVTNSTTTTTTTTSSDQTRTGTASSLGFNTVTQSTGEKVIDVNVIYYMRAVSINIASNGLRPNTDLHCFFDDVNMNANVVPATGYSAVGEGCARTDANGNVFCTLNIPNGKFRTGDRTIVLIDDANNVTENATTTAKSVFYSNGLHETKQDTVISVRTPTVTTQTLTENRTVTETSSSSTTTSTVTHTDPLAQTFTIPGQSNPYGVYVTGLDIFFKRKPTDNIPVWAQIRPTSNGYPHSSTIVPFSTVYLSPSSVNVPSLTNDMNTVLATPTHFEFPIPVYLSPDVEYSIVVGADSEYYECYVAEVGQFVLGSNTIATQNGDGSLFKSQNAKTWTASQSEDLMFQLYRASFTPGASGLVVFQGLHTHDVPIHLLNHESSYVDFDGATKVSHEIKVKDAGASSPPTTWSTLISKIDVPQTTPKIFDGATSLQIRATLSTTREDVAPMYDTQSNSVVCVQNIVNNLGLKSSDFVVNDPGSGWTTAPTVTISGGGGSGASAHLILTSGRITGVVIDTQGSGYISSPTITLSGGVGGAGGSISYTAFETGGFGGNAHARYITRSVTLADEFTTDYMTVTFDVNIQSGANVKVYVKELAGDDSATMDSRPWTEMIVSNNTSFTATNNDTFYEIGFIPNGGSLSYVSSGVTHNSVKTYAIKIVMLSDNPCVVPRIRDMRVVTVAP